MDSLYAYKFIKSDYNTGVLLWILKNFQVQQLCKTFANRCFFDSVSTCDVVRFTVFLQYKKYGTGASPRKFLSGGGGLCKILDLLFWKIFGP